MPDLRDKAIVAFFEVEPKLTAAGCLKFRQNVILSAFR
jgi:hypothetical protein